MQSARGPSSVTVDAPMSGVSVGEAVVIRGTVTDVSPGTQQTAIQLRFPNGVPAVSDNNMTSWMQYVYEQFAEPTNIQGVNVEISVIDSNGNLQNNRQHNKRCKRHIQLGWTPDISGKYTVIATFAGTNSYYGSSAQTAFIADEASQQHAPTASPAPASMADQYFVPAVAAIIIVLSLVGAVLAILLLRKRP